MAREILTQQFAGILLHLEAAASLRMAEPMAPIGAGSSHTKV
jgi:hypothetical protein